MQDTFAIKGVKDGLLITLNPVEEWNRMTASLAAHLDEQSRFFAGARIIVDVGERPVPKAELASLKALLDRRGLVLWAVLSESVTTIDATIALDLRTDAGTAVPRPVDEQLDSFDSEESGVEGVMIRRTLRSGRTVHSTGHVVIYGDVNPGAEVTAVGDIVVWGRLRGNAHAGVQGDETAVICALDMIPTQLRIADYIVTSPAEKRSKLGPEVALVRDNQIIVETWK
ncbi:MAG: septum site-determining protein MinC [Anaerolineae bacterium]|nr:septum site-determining protein MinC [Anaerolineae bacterium]